MEALTKKTQSLHSCTGTLLPQLGRVARGVFEVVLCRRSKFGGHAAVANMELVGPHCCCPPPGKLFCGQFLSFSSTGLQNCLGAPDVIEAISPIQPTFVPFVVIKLLISYILPKVLLYSQLPTICEAHFGRTQATVPGNIFLCEKNMRGIIDNK